ARLSDLKLRGADPDPVADHHVSLEQTFSREVLAERSPRQLHVRKFRTPERIVLARININSFVGTAVNGQVRLLIAIDVERAHDHPPVRRSLPDRSRHNATSPLDFTRKADVHGDELHSMPTSRRSRHCLLM